MKDSKPSIGVAKIKPSGDLNDRPFYEGGLADEEIDPIYFQYESNFKSDLIKFFKKYGYVLKTKGAQSNHLEILCEIIREKVQGKEDIIPDPRLESVLKQYDNEKFQERLKRRLDVIVIVYNWISSEIKTKNALKDDSKDKPYGAIV